MKYLALLLLFNPLCATLILQFDVNGTIVAFDKATHASLEQYLNRALYEHAHPCPPQLPRKERYSFLEHMRNTGDPHLPQMEALYKKMWDKLEGKDTLFPSLLKLLDYLERCEIPYTLALRTFGFDGAEVTRLIEKQRPGFFKGKGTFRDNVLHIEGEKPVSDPLKQFEILASGNYALQDDFQYWHQHDRLWRYGKPLLLDPCRDDFPLFFDDNINPDFCSPHSVVDPINARTGKHISPACVSENLIHVDTVEAILNDNYFIELVQCALTCIPRAA